MDLPKSFQFVKYETPPPKKRLPRALSGTKAAEERKKMLQKLRQRRKRAREKAETRRRETLVTSSDEEAAPDTPLQQQELPGGAGSGDDQEELHARQPHFRCLDYQEEEIIAGRETVQLQANDRSMQQEDGDSPPPTPAPAPSSRREEINALAREFALVKCSTFVSDAGIDKLLKVFIANHDVIMKLVQGGVIAGNYTKGIRPLLTAQILPIYCSLLLKVESANGPTYKTIKDLKVVPAKYLDLPATEGTRLLRCETYVHLKDVKRHYLEEHGRTAETLNHLRNCAVSADGVAESKKGSRTFVVVTVRFGTCLYPVRIFNPLIGVEESKPTPKEILRYTSISPASEQYNNTILVIIVN